MSVEIPEFHGHSFPLRIVLCQTPRAWSGLMEHMGVTSERPAASASVTWFQNNDRDDIIAININGERIAERSYSERIALYAHECVHVGQRIAKSIGSRLGSEVEAYLVQALLLWLINECEDWL